MITKFPKSNIQINGLISIAVYNHNESIEENLPPNKIIPIDLRGLKYSKSGVYCLRNKLNGRLYIGMTNDLERRYWRHCNDLLKGKHPSKLLQSDFDEFFKDYFALCQIDIQDLLVFEVIQYCYPSQLTFWENILITHLNPYYNIHKQKEITFGCDLDKEPSVGFSHIYNKETGLIDCIDNKGNKVAEYGFDE